MATFVTQTELIEETKAEDPELYDVFMEMVNARAKDLAENNAEIDRRFPV